MTRHARRAGLGVALALMAFVCLAAASTEATTFPPGFGQDVIAGGFNSPTVFAFFPDGRIIVAEKPGVVWLIKNGVVQPVPFINVSDRVNSAFDHGILGLAVDRDFPAQPYVYLYYTYENDPVTWDGPKTVHLSRVTVTGDTADPNSEVVILGTQAGVPCNLLAAGSDCIASDSGSHSAGNLKFASDGTIFLTVGDGADFNVVNPDALRAQNLDLLNGKLLRITRDGQGVSTNPFWTGDPNANRSKVWALGLRNAYRLNLRPGSDIPYVGDVGWGNWEEVSAAPAGANLGWPCYEGSGQQGGYAPDPICQAFYAGLPPPVPSLASTGVIIAKVAESVGAGASVSAIRDADKPPVGTNDPTRQYDSYNGGNPATEDWIGYTFGASHTFNQVVFQEGMHFSDGGWFNTLNVQVRQAGTWVNVPGLVMSPAYPGNNGVNFETFTLTFTPTTGDGIRLYGAPGGSAAFISVGELEVYEVDGSGGGGGGGGGGTPVETGVTAQAQAAIAKVPASLGAGGSLAVIRDGDKPPIGTYAPPRQYDSYDGANAAANDWVGYTFASPQNFDRLVFQEGINFGDGGWFNTLTVQVQQNGTWVNVPGLVITPAYPGNNGVNFETFTLTFTPTTGDGIRLYGAPGGSSAFISVGELEVYALVTPPSSPPGSPGSPTQPFIPHRPPVWEYAHNGLSAAVTAGAFYTGTAYPAQYQGAYFFGDYSLSLLRTMRVDTNDAMVPGSLFEFAQSADGPVDIEIGPDGLIYYLSISAGELRRIRYTAGNTPPVAVASATPTAGVAPLSVQFSSAGSNDPDGDPITYSWDFGDGLTGTGPSPQHTYQLPNGIKTATLTVQDNRGGASSKSVTITIGNLPPIPSIGTPAASFQYKVGDVIAYSGSSTNSPGDPVPGATLTWQILLHHCPGGACHTHPYWSSTGASGSFTVPDHGDDSYFEFVLTATDSAGLSATAARDILPKPVAITLATAPTGLQVVYDGTTATSPFTKTTIVGSTHTITAPISQGPNTFTSWSDGGAPQHEVTLGTTNVTYTATFSGGVTCPTGQYKAEYFNNVNLTDTPVLTRCETTINNNWGTGGPGNGVPNDNFSARWTGRFTFAAGSTTFTTVSDDGVRLWVDNVQLINRWTDHGSTTDTATQTITAGDHDVKVEYYERGGGAVIQASWVTSQSSCPVGQYRAEYFNNVNLTGTPVFARCETTINNNWGNGGPGNGVPNDNFSVRWTGRFTFTAGQKTFTTRSDDGIRMWVDNVQIINRWTDHGPTNDTATRVMTAGDHDVKVEYYERGGGAVAQASWTP